MTKPPVLLLYGLDEASHDFEVDATLSLTKAANDALRARGWRVMPLQITHDFVAPLRPFHPSEWVVLNLCEGSPAQEFYYARTTRALRELGYTFTGSDAWSLDETQYKHRTKAILERVGVPTPVWTIAQDGDTLDSFSRYPAIVKPAAEHCSYGITRQSVVLNDAEARRQVTHIVTEFKQPAIVEEFLDSAEYNVSVWDNGETAHVLGISTMTYDAFDDIHDRLCTFDAKWTPASEAYQCIPAVCPAPVSTALAAKIECAAIGAYRASGCRDYGRVDMRLRRDGSPDGQPMVLDINANCDVSPDGGFANAARASGLSYAEMIERIVLMAVQRMSAGATNMTVHTLDSVHTHSQQQSSQQSSQQQPQLEASR